MQQIKQNLNIENEYCDHMKWEISKFEIYFFIIKFSTKLAQSQKKKRYHIEYNLKKLEENLDYKKILQKSNFCKNKLEVTYGNKAEGIKGRNKIEWHFDVERTSFLI